MVFAPSNANHLLRDISCHTDLLPPLLFPCFPCYCSAGHTGGTQSRERRDGPSRLRLALQVRSQTVFWGFFSLFFLPLSLLPSFFLPLHCPYLSTQASSDPGSHRETHLRNSIQHIKRSSLPIASLANALLSGGAKREAGTGAGGLVKRARGKPQIHDVRMDTAWKEKSKQTVRWNKPISAATAGGQGSPLTVTVKMIDGDLVVAALATRILNKGYCEVTVPGGQ